MPEATSTRPRAVSYVRVSSVGQAEDGFGLEVQRKAARQVAKAHHLRIVQTCEDPAVSGTIPATERPGLSCALDALRGGKAEVLVIARLDRLARELTVQEAALALVWRLGGRVFTADGGEVLRDDPDDPMRTAMRQMVGVFAQLDRGSITKRLRDGRRTSAERGGRGLGGSPRYGFHVDAGRLVEDAEEQAVIARMVAGRETGLSLRQIAAALNSDGIGSKRGGKWQTSGVARVLSPAIREQDAARQARYRDRDARLDGKPRYRLRPTDDVAQANGS